MGNTASAGAPPQYGNQIPAAPGYYPRPPQPPVLGPSPYYGHPASWAGSSQSVPLNTKVERQKAVAVRSDVNFKESTLRLLPDVEHPGRLLIAFNFDATVDGRITIIYFAQEDADFNLKGTKEDLLKPVRVPYQAGQNQEFTQPSGTGIDVTLLDESELCAVGEGGIFPISIELETSPSKAGGQKDEEIGAEAYNSVVMLAVLENTPKPEYKVRLVKQIRWIDGIKYEMQEIYGIGNSVVEKDEDGESGNDCVVCLSKPIDTTLCPCRHMCVCSECAWSLKLLSNRCPMCRQPVEGLLEIEVDGKSLTKQDP